MKLAIYILLIFTIVMGKQQDSPFSYYPEDKFALIMNKMNKVNSENCLLKSWEELTLPPKSVGQIPVFNNIHKVHWMQNRTSLLLMHAMAINRGFYYSYILQKFNETKEVFKNLPNLHYYYLSASSDVSANPGIINGSSIFYDTNCMYANWYANLDFNITLSLFGPKAWRMDDWNDDLNWLRGEPTNYTIKITDYGAGPNHNYTSPTYKFNPWIKDKERKINFIPDFDRSNEQEHQMDFNVEDLYSNSSVKKKLYSFFGPPQPGVKEAFQPVRFTRPYYDCGRSNKWIVTAVGPLVDVMARNVPNKFKSVRHPQIVGISTMDIDFIRIDFNPCPESKGNDPHYFVGVARCKPTTVCEPLIGFGFRRGGYQCHCKPGYRFPFYQNGPFQGVDIEIATNEEYKSGFDCIKSNWLQVIPELNRDKRSVLPPSQEQTTNVFSRAVNYGLKSIKDTLYYFSPRKPNRKLVSRFNAPPKPAAKEDVATQSENSNGLHPKHKIPETLKRFSEKLNSAENKNSANEVPLSRRKRSLDYTGRKSGFDSAKWPEINKLMKLVKDVSHLTCKKYPENLLNLPGEVGYGSERVFEVQGRIALRLAHFLSAYYQNNIKNEKYGNLRPGRTLEEEHFYGEIFANVASDKSILSSGVFFDRHKFQDNKGSGKNLFGPFAYKDVLSNQAYEAADLGHPSYPSYTEKPWFRFLKERWGSNSYGLELFRAKPWVRSDLNGTQVRRYFHYPLFYKVPRYEDGYWSNPYFDCKGKVKKWLITYSAPFFGRIGLSENVEFMGVVAVSVPLENLDIDQCPNSFYTPNFFKNTATCDYESSYCVPLAGYKFKLGYYKCECRQGYEFPFVSAMWFYLGGDINGEYQKMIEGKKNRYNSMVCRESGVARIGTSMSVIIISLAVTVVQFGGLY